MTILSELTKPVFRKAGPGEARNAEERDDAAAVATYRYLRLGLVVIAIALIASVLIQHRNADCWQGSISAYYYSPARAVFVSGLIAIAVSLIVIKGSTVLEDALLTLAGAMAPIVAFVPTTFEPPCRPGRPLGDGCSELPSRVVRDAQNNLSALLVAGIAALLIGIIVLVAERRGARRATTGQLVGQVILLVVTAVLVGIGGWLLATERILDLHGWSAVAMFGVLALASIFNGGWLLWINRGDRPKTSRRWKALGILYITVGGSMVVAGAIIKFGVRTEWDHRTLVLEFVEIGLFAAMWTVQSIERWGKALQTEAPPAGAN